MVEFYKLKDTTNLLGSIFSAINEAERSRETETAAARCIQSATRAAAQHKRYRTILVSCIHIQRIWRGHVGRRVARERRVEYEEHQKLQVLDYFASVVQRRWRGFYCRKTTANYAELQEYKRTILARNDQVRDLARQHQQSQKVERVRRRECEEKDFRESASRLHYLVSTHSVKGVYQGRGTVFNSSVEDVLRRSATVQVPQGSAVKAARARTTPRSPAAADSVAAAA